MSGTIDLRVLGVPAPQGSKTRMPNGAMVEGGSATGRAKHRAWRTAVAEAAAYAAETHGRIRGPVSMAVEFHMPRPASRKRDHWADRKPDLDKLLRTTFDGITDGGLIEDDSRIAVLTTEKVLADEWTGAIIRLERL